MSKDSKRPLFNNNNPKEVLENLLKKRESNFLKAHYIIDTSTINEEEIVETILGSINETDTHC